MPKLKQSPTEKNKEMIRRKIKAGCAMHDLNIKILASRIQVSDDTLYSRMQDPFTFKLGELWRISTVIKIPLEELIGSENSAS